jgi:hypothetical protein
MRHTAPLRRVSLIVGALLVAGCAGSEQSAGSGTEQTRTQIPAGQGAAAMPSADNLIRHMRSLMDLQETAHPALQRFLASNTPRAFAIAPNGASGWASGGSNAASVDQRAIATCESRGGEGGCAVALRDLAIVKPGREWAPASPAAGEGIRSFTHETVPDHRFFWWGPQQGHGVLVFAHGKSGRNDMRGDQPQPWWPAPIWWSGRNFSGPKQERLLLSCFVTWPPALSLVRVDGTPRTSAAGLDCSADAIPRSAPAPRVAC